MTMTSYGRVYVQLAALLVLFIQAASSHDHDHDGHDHHYQHVSRIQEESDYGFVVDSNVHIDSHKHCGTHEPSPKEREEERQKMEEWKLQNTDLLGAAQEEIIICVHFHVIQYDNGTGGVTDEQIEKQMNVLNEGFSGGGMTDFCGNSSNGRPASGAFATPFQFVHIGTTRTNNTAWSDLSNPYMEAEAKTALRKGDEATLNIYICPDLDPHGYATFPFLLKFYPLLDGIVLVAGTLPDGDITNYKDGEVATHEVGHWLGLHHTFSERPEESCEENAGDSIIDTPSETSPARGCPTARDTCPGGGLDPVTNFMDYTYHCCMFEFTEGQSERMLAAWNMYRTSGVSCEQLSLCGNGELDDGEECDDGNTDEGDGCNSLCQIVYCGNGRVERGEECDGGNTNNSDWCDSMCRAVVCGNARVEGGEECDDGNTDNGDDCDSLCQIVDCGNGRVEGGEECDDGNTNNGDRCNSECMIEGKGGCEVEVEVKAGKGSKGGFKCFNGVPTCYCDVGFEGFDCGTEMENIFSIVSGSCTIDAEGCILSPNYPDLYPSGVNCEITAASGATLNVVAFNSEVGYDFLTVNGVKYSGTVGPDGQVIVDALDGCKDGIGSVMWITDINKIESGWKVCASGLEPIQRDISLQKNEEESPFHHVFEGDNATNISKGIKKSRKGSTFQCCHGVPTCNCDIGFAGPDCDTEIKKEYIFSIVSGNCTIDAEGCILSPNYPGQYPVEENCEITAALGATLNVVAFNSELVYDFLTVNGVVYSGTMGPDGQVIVDDLDGCKDYFGKVTWYSDSSSVDSGWKVCADIFMDG